MSVHEVEYDQDGLSKNDPWTLGEYLSEDGFSPREQAVILESVASWLREYETACVDMSEAIGEIT